MASALSDSDKLNFILAAVTELKRNQDDLKLMFENKLDSLKHDLMQSIDTKVSSLRDELSVELCKESGRIDEIMSTIGSLQTKIDLMGKPSTEGEVTHDTTTQRGTPACNDDEHGIIASGVPFSQEEDLLHVARGIVDALGVSSAVNIVNTTRFPSYNDKPGLVKIVFSCTEDKVLALRNKMRLKDNASYNDVYVKSCKSRIERLLEQNMRTIIRHLPQGQNYRVAANGRIQERIR